MKCNVALIYLSLVFLPKMIICQDVEIRKQVIANVGVYHENNQENGLSLFSTVGQSVGTQIEDVDKYVFFEGFQDGNIPDIISYDGGESKIKKLDLSTFPNPFQNKINIRLNNLLHAGYYILNITDLQGKLVMSKNIFISNQVITITLPNLIAGNYVLYITDHNKNVVYNKNIIKN